MKTLKRSTRCPLRVENGHRVFGFPALSHSKPMPTLFAVQVASAFWLSFGRLMKSAKNAAGACVEHIFRRCPNNPFSTLSPRWDRHQQHCKNGEFLSFHRTRCRTRPCLEAVTGRLQPCTPLASPISGAAGPHPNPLPEGEGAIPVPQSAVVSVLAPVPDSSSHAATACTRAA